MKKILYIIFVLLPFVTKAQFKVYSSHAGIDVNGSTNAYHFYNGPDSIMGLFPNVIRHNKVITLATFATGSEPSIPWSMGFDSDSTTNAVWYRDGAGGVHRFGSIGGSGGGGASTPFPDNTALVENNADHTKLLILSAANISTATTRTWTFPDVNGTVARSDAAQTFSGIQTFANKLQFAAGTTSGSTFNIPVGVAPTTRVNGDTWYDGTNWYFYNGTANLNLLATASAFTQGGNAFGTTATFGTTDNNFLKFISNSIVVMSIFQDGHVAFGSSATDPTQFVYFPGTSRFDGTMTIGANGGFSVQSGFNFSSFASNTATNNFGFNWAMNNAYSSGVKYANRFAGDMSLTSGTDTITNVYGNPTINNSGGGAYVSIGYRWAPIKTSMTNTKAFAWFNDGAGLIYNTGIPAGIGTENVLVQGNDSVIRQVPFPTGGSQTFQQTLTTGSTLTGTNSVTNTGQSFTWTNGGTGLWKWSGLSQDTTNTVGLYASFTDSSIRMLPWAKLALKIADYLPTYNLFAANGLRAAGGDSLYLGGNLNQNTTINPNGFNLLVSGSLNVNGSSATAGPALTIDGNVSSTFSANTKGFWINLKGGNTYTEGSSGTLSSAGSVFFGTETWSAGAATTYLTGATLSIGGPPTAGSNVTITSPYSLFIFSGNMFTGGNILTGQGQTISTTHILGNNSGGTPISISAGAGAGTSPTVSVSGTDMAGTVTVTSGTAPTGSNATIVTLTYGFAFPSSSSVTLTPANAATAALSGISMIYAVGSTTNFVIASGTTALSGATTYKWNYQVGGN